MYAEGCALTADGDIFIRAIIDTKSVDGTNGARTLEKRIGKMTNVTNHSTSAIRKNDEWWTRHIVTLRVAQNELKKVDTQLNKLWRPVKTGTIEGVNAVDATSAGRKAQAQQIKDDQKLQERQQKDTDRAAEKQRKLEERKRKFASDLYQNTKKFEAQQTADAQTNIEKQRKFSSQIYQNTQKFHNDKEIKKNTWYSNLRQNTAAFWTDQANKDISRQDALTDARVAIKDQGKPISQGTFNILTKGLPPKVADSYHRTWRESKRLFGQADHMKRYADSMHKVSMAALAANMSALGLFFSMFSVINLMRQGLGALMGPLGDVGSMFETLAMSAAFGTGVEYDANKMVDAWMRFTGLKSDIGATLAVLGAEVLTDPAVWEAISTGVKAFMDELRKPETIEAIKAMVIALANALPKIAKEIPGIANFVKDMAPWLEVLLPLAMKAAIAMPFLSLVTGVASLAAAFLSGIAAIVRFRAAYKSLGLLGALGGLAGVEGGAVAAGGAAGILSKVSLSSLLPLAGRALGAIGVGVLANDILKALGIRPILDNVVDGFAKVFADIPIAGVFYNGFYSWYESVTGILDTISELLAGDFEGAFNTLMTMFDKIQTNATSTLSATFQPVIDALTWIYNTLSTLYENVMKTISSISSDIASNPLIASLLPNGAPTQPVTYPTPSGGSSVYRDQPQRTNQNITVNFNGTVNKKDIPTIEDAIRNAAIYGGGY